MKMVPAICTQCNGKIEVDSSQEAAVCKFCGTAFIVERAINNFNTYHNEIYNTDINNNDIKQTHYHGAAAAKIGAAEKREEEERREKREKRRKRLAHLKRHWKDYLLVILILYFVASVGLGSDSQNDSSVSSNRYPPIERYAPVPEVIGVNYVDALAVVEFAGFECTAVEVEAKSILPGLIGDHDATKGDVIQINDRISGYVTDVAPGGKVVLLYARDNYTAEKNR